MQRWPNLCSSSLSPGCSNLRLLMKYSDTEVGFEPGQPDEAECNHWRLMNHRHSTAERVRSSKNSAAEGWELSVRPTMSGWIFPSHGNFLAERDTSDAQALENSFLASLIAVSSSWATNPNRLWTFSRGEI
jgi:hypothetical protein